MPGEGYVDKIFLCFQLLNGSQVPISPSDEATYETSSNLLPEVRLLEHGHLN